MEPFSIWAFTVVAAALGVGLTLAGNKKKSDKSGQAAPSAAPKSAPVARPVRPPAAAKEAGDVFDAEKEKAIDALIAERD